MKKITSKQVPANGDLSYLVDQSLKNVSWTVFIRIFAL
jgi:hypothetical protein